MADGSLQLALDHDPYRNLTVLGATEERPPLRVLRAFARGDGSALVHLHNLSGGVLGGDTLSLDVNVSSNAQAQITTTGSTRIYRCRDDARAAVQTTRITVGDGASLEYLPDPVIPFAGSRYTQRTHITLGENAVLYWWETFAPGRDGESFAYASLESEVEIRTHGADNAYGSASPRPRLCARERWRLAPHERPLNSLVRMGEYRYHSTFYICHSGRDASEWLGLEQQLAAALPEQKTALWGVSTLAAHGVVIRALSSNARDIASGLDALWKLAAKLIEQRETIAPRKMY